MVEKLQLQENECDSQWSKEEREEGYEQLWDEAGFIMWVRQPKRDQFFLRVHGHLDMTPMQTHRVFTNPDNSKVFRDVESIISRRLLQVDQDTKVVEVKQRARWRILIFGGTMVSHLVVREEPKKGKINFQLAQPGLMKKWEGEWRLLNDGKNGTDVTLHLEVSPSFIPPFLSGLLRALTSGSTRRFIQDIQRVDRIFQQGGRSLDEILGNEDGVEEWCDPSQSSSCCPEVKSYEINFEDELIDGEFIEIEEDGSKLKWWQRLKSKIIKQQTEKKVVDRKISGQDKQVVRNEEKKRVRSERKRAKMERKLSKREQKRILKEKKLSLKSQKMRSKEEQQKEKLERQTSREDKKRLKKENISRSNIQTS